jgi:hypothetical protein
MEPRSGKARLVTGRRPPNDYHSFWRHRVGRPARRRGSDPQKLPGGPSSAFPRRARSLVTLCCIALLAGCAVAPPRPDLDLVAECRAVFGAMDEQIAAAGVQDGMAARVAGFPYLRASRFLASYAAAPMSDAQFVEWTGRMIELGRQAYTLELANLPVESRETLAHKLWNTGGRYSWPQPALAECMERLAVADRADPGRRLELARAVAVPDDYATWQRVAGIYWLTRIPFANGVRNWHTEVLEAFSRPLERLPVTGELRSYAPPPGGLSAAEVATVLRRTSANALAIPDPRGADRDALFRTFAPHFTVDTAGAADVPGELGWLEDGGPAVVSRSPVVYRRLSHARYGERVLVQLNYWIWFPERPKGVGWDILGGHLDGLLWRVTLAPDGTPWVFDTIHPCGCYHLFFPTARASPRPQPDSLNETSFVPQSLPRLAAGERLALRLESGTHYLQRVVVQPAPAPGTVEYALAEDDALRSLPYPGGGRRSAFRPDGIIAGSERGERWLFWPMGVPEPGAMRQWGRHATAFVGRRHFDDPGLLERYFSLEGVSSE